MSKQLATFPENFLFGIANAPGQVEDQLDDIWMDFGRRGKIKAFLNQASPEERLRFWTEPEVELDLASELGVQIFRLGVDWGRISPGPGVFDTDVLERYREILGMIRKRKIKIMLSLFHFSHPKWIQESGAWTNPESVAHFVEFSKRVIVEFNDLVDFWLTFNEPQVFAPMAYVFDMFPGSVKPSLGKGLQALRLMSEAHKEVYTWAHTRYPDIQISSAQHIGFHTAKDPFNKFFSRFTGWFMNWYFPERIKNHLDFFALNYYGAEWIKGAQIAIAEDEEYSEAGRAIYPQGLYHLSKEIARRYPGIPLFVTENGIGDSTDWIRPSYLIEHLLALSAARDEGVEFLGYIFWTLSDNFEWSDGYGPKFGLVEVKREENLERKKRDSFDLYEAIIKHRFITEDMRDGAWKKLQTHQGERRPFWRASDGKSGLDVPDYRELRKKDWRFVSSSR